ncbi:P-loop-containing kinase [Klebsiella pneumoniae]|uniref:P-loop-containing kinase n=1 Tax=Klebsiella pneumoniae TaxID=573 RepID=A0A378A5M9_KLEPN|nr:P-loop-containing kinase [Klebsiella pneumoniae]
MVLMIVSGRSGSGNPSLCERWKIWAFTAWITCRSCCCPTWRGRWLTVISPRPSASTCVTCRNPRRSSSRRCRICRNVFSPQLLFLDADRNTLIRRYSDTRRLHPLSSKNLSLESAIDEESDLLEPLLSRADLIVDTSEMSVHELAEMLRTRLLGKRERELTMVFESFGFKHGIPIDAITSLTCAFCPTRTGIRNCVQ